MTVASLIVSLSRSGAVPTITKYYKHMSNVVPVSAARVSDGASVGPADSVDWMSDWSTDTELRHTPATQILLANF